MAKYPKMKLDDPYAKRTPLWCKILCWVLVLLVIAFGVLYFTHNLGWLGL